MSDFGANTSDFDSDFRAGLSDYASDFCTEGNDYASDFCDFPGDSGSDFGREVRQSGPREDGMDGSEPAASETAPPQIDSRRAVTREAASWQRKRQATETGTTPRHKAINNAYSASGAALI